LRAGGGESSGFRQRRHLFERLGARRGNGEQSVAAGDGVFALERRPSGVWAIHRWRLWAGEELGRLESGLTVGDARDMGSTLEKELRVRSLSPRETGGNDGGIPTELGYGDGEPGLIVVGQLVNVDHLREEAREREQGGRRSAGAVQ
jgi:hypothetical protein